MDLIDEEDAAYLEAREDSHEIALSLQGGTRSGNQLPLHLVGHDVGERGLAQTRRPMEQNVLERLFALAGCLDGDSEILDDGLLAPKPVFDEGSRSEADDNLFFVDEYAVSVSLASFGVSRSEDWCAWHDYPFCCSPR